MTPNDPLPGEGAEHGDDLHGDDLVWGADVGGTSTRVGVADRNGTVLAVALAGPGNPHTTGIEPSAATVRGAADRALAIADPSGRRPVREGVVGLAGVSAVEPAHYARLVAPARSTTDPAVVVDLAVAYASGTPAPHGVVVLAGTGAGAMELSSGRVVSRYDAWGWLLGDEGSAQWIGRAAIRHTLAVLEQVAVFEQGEWPADRLAAQVLARLGVDPAGVGTGSPVDGLLRRVYRDPPRDLARLAPLVSSSTDPAATGILDTAARLVAGHAETVLAGRTDLPVVLAGSLAADGGPLHDRLVSALGPGVATVSSAADGVAGACWLALNAAEPQSGPVHRRLLDTVAAAARLLTAVRGG